MRSSSAPSSSDSSSDRPPVWVGSWTVVRYGGAPPAVPTYYDATRTSWDVIKVEDEGVHVAPHPILEVRDDILVLKDEGVPDADAERWRVTVQDDTVRVVALTGEHEGAVGVAERTDVDPREHHSGA